MFNSQTEIPTIPLPRIEEIFDRMTGCTVFSTLDLAQGYHQMLVESDSKKFTAFRTDKEVYQWRVAPMGLTGVPGVWSRLMRVLFDKFDFVVVYLDDLCVFSRSEDEHCMHLRAVFEVLRRERLYIRKEKCAFWRASSIFWIIQWLRMDYVSIAKELQSFLGLAGYYRKFICDSANLVLPLRDLVRKAVAWIWGDEQQHVFLQLKMALQQAPVLRLPDFSQRFILTTDASDTCCGGVLSQ
ncbi:polyprotein, partial [Phytophthora megakarya]